MGSDRVSGDVLMTPELNEAIGAVAKPVVAHITMSASANYYAAVAADHLVITQSGFCGSIGCYSLFIEVSRAIDAAGITAQYIVSKQSPNKTEGNPYEPASPEFLAFEQKQVDTIGRDFVAAVASARRVSPSEVEARFGGGRCLMAADAKRVSMVDAIGDLSVAVRAAASPSTLRAARVARLARDPAPRPVSSRQRRLELLRRS